MALERLELYKDERHQVYLVRGSGEIAEHVHEDSCEIAVLVEGEARVRIEGKEHVLRPYTAIKIPRGVRHSARLDGVAVVVYAKEV